MKGKALFWFMVLHIGMMLFLVYEGAQAKDMFLIGFAAFFGGMGLGSLLVLIAWERASDALKREWQAYWREVEANNG